MTVFDFIPNYDGSSDWCKMVSDCLDAYEAICGSDKYPGQIYCRWPITDRNMFYDHKKWGVRYLKGYSSFEDYMSSNPKVVYEMDFDQFISNIRNTDGTLDCAFQNEKYLCYTHIGNSKYFDKEGFGCVINKMTNEIHFVALGEDDGNYWGNYEIEIDELSSYEISLISSVVNHLPSDLFWDKEKLIDLLFTNGKKC